MFNGSLEQLAGSTSTITSATNILAFGGLL